MKQRNMSFELMRLLMVFGIVLLHVITQSGYLEAGGAFARKFINLLYPCVVGFVFISGWFGIKFSPGKAARLVGLFLFYELIFSWPCGYDSIVERILSDWFVWGYLVLMMLAPIFNAALESQKSNIAILRVGLPFLFSVYVWGYLCVVPGIRNYVPCPTGMTHMSFFSLSGIYVAARMFRLMDLERYIEGARVRVCIWMLSAAIVFIGFHHHNSVASFVFVACLFITFKGVRLNPSLSKSIEIIAPSAFAVYLLHSSAMGRWLFKWIIRQLIEVGHIPVPLAYFLDAGLIVLACLVVDVARRMLVCRVWRD